MVTAMGPFGRLALVSLVSLLVVLAPAVANPQRARQHRSPKARAHLVDPQPPTRFQHRQLGPLLGGLTPTTPSSINSAASTSPTSSAAAPTTTPLPTSLPSSSGPAPASSVISSSSSGLLPSSLPVTPSSASSSASSSVPSSASSSASSIKVSQVIVTVTSTNADGTEFTSTSSLQSSSVPVSNKSSSNTGKTWGIVGGVVGGVIIFAGVLFVVWRFTQRRFSDLDDGGDDIKWPELQPDGQTTAANTSTLNPMGTRRTGGAGIEMDGDGKDESDAYAGSMYYSQEHATGSYEQVGVYGNQSGAGGAYYDPYLGPSAAPQPAPQNIYPPPNRPYSPYGYSRSGSTDEIPMGPMNPSSPRAGGSGSPRAGSPRIMSPAPHRVMSPTGSDRL